MPRMPYQAHDHGLEDERRRLYCQPVCYRRSGETGGKSNGEIGPRDNLHGGKEAWHDRLDLPNPTHPVKSLIHPSTTGAGDADDDVPQLQKPLKVDGLSRGGMIDTHHGHKVISIERAFPDGRHGPWRTARGRW